jgi:nucleoside-triphosphatase THEP1
MQELGLTGVMNLREAHAELIKKALISQDTYIFLTGNPGIGKTTAIVDFLKNHIDEGFLFFYVSPRKQVNLDIIEKFKNKETGNLCDDRLLAINSHSNLITDNFGSYTVEYTCNQCQGNFLRKSVHFIDSREVERIGRRSDKLKKLSDDVIQDNKKKKKGVLNSIFEAISTIVEDEVSNNIIATASIQALKTTQTDDTLKHFEKIFRNAYNERENIVFPERMREISGRIKHLFIMIDEITGDDSGVDFLDGIDKIISKYKLNDNQYGFNTKVIVADASIVDKNVIIQHLSNKSPEPDKIYFRRSTEIAQPLSIKPLVFKDFAATVINTNSYPAKNLSITYKVLIESCKFSEEARLKQKYNLEATLQKEILKDIEAFLNQSDVEQIIVYIQNQRRLAELIEKIIANNTLEEIYQIRLLDIANSTDELWLNMQQISHRKSYPESLRSAIKDAIELVTKLRDGVEKTQRLEQFSQRFDQYYALPLYAFISGEAMSEYFGNEPNEPEDERFRDILAAYIRVLYPVGNILPIGNNYQDFPFVVFRSYSLEEMRQKVFTEKYLLSSNELNVLNLILSKDSVFTS